MVSRMRPESRALASTTVMKPHIPEQISTLAISSTSPLGHHKGLDVQQRCAVEGIQPSHHQHPPLSSDQLHKAHANGVGTARATQGEYPSFGMRGISSGMLKQFVALRQMEMKFPIWAKGS